MRCCAFAQAIGENPYMFSHIIAWIVQKLECVSNMTFFFTVSNHAVNRFKCAPFLKNLGDMRNYFSS